MAGVGTVAWRAQLHIASMAPRLHVGYGPVRTADVARPGVGIWGSMPHQMLWATPKLVHFYSSTSTKGGLVMAVVVLVGFTCLEAKGFSIFLNIFSSQDGAGTGSTPLWSS